MARIKTFLKSNWKWLGAGVAAALVVVYLLFRSRSGAGAQVVSLPASSQSGGGGGGSSDTGSASSGSTDTGDPITNAAEALMQYALQAERMAQMATDPQIAAQWKAEADQALSEASNLINEVRSGAPGGLTIGRTPGQPPAPSPPPGVVGYQKAGDFMYTLFRGAPGETVASFAARIYGGASDALATLRKWNPNLPADNAPIEGDIITIPNLPTAPVINRPGGAPGLQLINTDVFGTPIPQVHPG